MKYITNNIVSIIPGLFLFLLSLPVLSCKKFVEVKPPKTSLIETVVFSNDESANSAVAGLYSQMNATLEYLSYGGASLYAGLCSDEITNTSASENYDAFSQSNLLANNSTVGSFWTSAYAHIYQANAIVEGLSKTTRITPAVKTQLTGEAKFVRAFFYFYLSNFFGDVPLVLNTDYRKNANLPRIPKNQIYPQIVEDLLEAQRSLPENYVNSSNIPTTERVRPNKFSAAALLARVYLYNADWASAETQAATVINNFSLFTLENDLTAVFKKDSKEVLWQIQPVLDPFNSAEGYIFIPYSSADIPSFIITAYLENAFEPADSRKVNWLGKNIVDTLSYYYPHKYKVQYGWPASEYNIVLRLAEQYLIRAEARANQNNIAGAQEDLNKIRNRALLDNTTAMDKASLLVAIENERRCELFTEWGHRWFDLKRTGRVDNILTTVKGANWQSTDSLFPIPLNEIKLNDHLTQNPGY